jgi:hypothetical protein
MHILIVLSLVGLAVAELALQLRKDLGTSHKVWIPVVWHDDYCCFWISLRPSWRGFALVHVLTIRASFGPFSVGLVGDQCTRWMVMPLLKSRIHSAEGNIAGRHKIPREVGLGVGDGRVCGSTWFLL